MRQIAGVAFLVSRGPFVFLQPFLNLTEPLAHLPNLAHWPLGHLAHANTDFCFLF